MANEMCAICGDPDGEMHNVTLADTPSKHPIHRFTTVKPKFWTAADVHEWISTNVNLNEGCHETPEAAALWWLAVEYAELVGDMNTRERASMYIEGVMPLTEQDVTDKVQYMNEDQEDADEQIEADLKSFFSDRC